MAIRELTCVLHVHSLHSDGTGTITEIAAAAGVAGADVVIVTDHDRMSGAVDAGWHDGVLVAVGVEVSPSHGSHVLALGVPRPIRHGGRTLTQVVDAVHASAPGAVAFAAHPFSRGGWVLGRAGRPAPFGDLRVDVDGIEVWSLVTDTLEYLRSPWRLLRLGRDPDAVLADPPAANLAAWDAIGATRRLPAVAGLDAHQYGVRRHGRVRLRTMSYARSFALLRTHALVDVEGDDPATVSAAVYAAFAAGRSFIARDSLADATGFRFGTADGTAAMGDEVAFGAVAAGAQTPRSGSVQLLATAPREAELRLWRDGELVARAVSARELRAVADGPGVYRVSGHLEHRGRTRTWILGNPLYLRGQRPPRTNVHYAGAVARPSC
jgi:hypothetical protein